VGVSKNWMKGISSLDGNEALVKAKGEAQVTLSPKYHKSIIVYIIQGVIGLT
jgi:hypothetical protein